MNSTVLFSTNINQELLLRGEKDIKALFNYMNTEVFNNYEYSDSFIKVREIYSEIKDAQLSVRVQVDHMQNLSKEQFKEAIENLKNDLNEYFCKHPTLGKIPQTAQVFAGRDFFTKFNDDSKDFYALQVFKPNYIDIWEEIAKPNTQYMADFLNNIEQSSMFRLEFKECNSIEEFVNVEPVVSNQQYSQGELRLKGDEDRLYCALIYARDTGKKLISINQWGYELPDTQFELVLHNFGELKEYGSWRYIGNKGGLESTIDYLQNAMDDHKIKNFKYRKYVDALAECI